MEIIDEEGRLLGAVNIVDALVVLLVFAVALAGIALVASGESTETETRHVTLDLGTQPEFIVERLVVGDTATLEDEFGNMTITDTHLTTADDGSRLVVRVAVTGREPVEGGQFTLGGEPLRLGRQLTFQNDTYVVNGTVSAVGTDRTLPTGNSSVVLRTTVSDDVARTVETGDDISVGDEPVGSVRDVAVYDAGTLDRRTLYLFADLETLANGEGVQFGDTPVEVGNTLSVPVAGNQYNWTVERVGSGFDRETNEVIVTDVVDPATANALAVGDAYEVAGQPVATIEDLAVYDTGNPDQKRVYVGLSTTTLGYGERPRFGPRTLQQGATISFRATSYEFAGEIVRDGTADLQTTTRDVVVTDVVDVSVADRLEEGVAYTVADEPVATVESVAVYGTDDPDRKRVYVGLSVEALGYSDELRFGANRPLREGTTLPFRTPSYEFQGEIVRVGTLTESGETAERTVTLQMANVPPERADSVEEGLTETSGDETVARVLDVQVEPAVITLTSESGDIFEREHPVNKDVTLTVELQVRELESGVRFKGRILQEGNEVILDLGTTTVRTTVVELDAT